MNSKSRLSATLILAATVIAGGCQATASSEQIAQSIRAILSSPSTPATDKEVSTDVHEVYNSHGALPLWVLDGQAKGRRALAIIRTASDHGLEPSDYGEDEIARRLEQVTDEKLSDRSGELARLDVLITNSLLDLGRDVAMGRVNPRDISSSWKHQREAPDFVSTLLSASEADLAGWLDVVRPRHREYAMLQSELRRLHGHVAGQSGADEDRPALADAPSDDRIRTLAINLERWRWLPDDLGASHVLVNIPSFSLVARDEGQTTLSMAVIVGARDTATPVFSSEMATLVFSPYWNIPDSIIEGEIAMEAARDPDYLRRTNIDILRVTKDGAKEVKPSSVDWEDAEGLKGLAFRQRPGAHNALGHVKFLFPNPYNVYLHDTPADALFAREDRALSHGCVRVAKPDELSAFVLRHQPEWDTPRRHEAMNAGVEKHVALTDKLPVHIVYMTAWSDATGAIQFSQDIYGLDAAQAKLDHRLAR